MRPLQDTTRSISIGQAFIEDRDAGADDKTFTKNIIKQANSVNIALLFKLYKLNIDEYNRKCICPFPFHNERGASFFYYKDTNSFFCFGCKHGGGPVEFISFMDDIVKYSAAEKILTNFEADSTLMMEREAFGFQEKHNLFLQFSENMRNFIMENLDDKDALDYAERISLIFDTINSRHRLDNAGIRSLIDKLKIKLDQFKV